MKPWATLEEAETARLARTSRPGRLPRDLRRRQPIIRGGTWVRVWDCDIGTGSNYATKNPSIVRGLRYHRRVYRLLEAYVAVTCPDQVLYVEPWLEHVQSNRRRQPDAVLVDTLTNTGIVIEAKLNWKDGRDEKLIQEYLWATQSAFGLELTWPALVTSNVAGAARGQVLLGLKHLQDCCDWIPGDPTPMVLVP